LAVEYGIKFLETSAKASINVEEAFFTLARDIKAKMEKKLVSIYFSSFPPSTLVAVLYKKIIFLGKISELSLTFKSMPLD
jgi:hypothetical protein